MATGEAPAPAARRVVSRPSPAESARFGRSVERLAAGEETDLTAVRDAVRASVADLVILRYPADRVGWFAELLDLPGRDAIFADCVTYWRLPAGAGRRPPDPAGFVTSPLTDPEAAGSLVAEIFRGYRSHYLANPLLDPAGALAGYQEWALRSVREGGCLALRDGQTGEILALATLEETPGRTEILLAGVIPRAQGRGHYAHLLKGVEDRALARGAAEVEISTQAHNLRVQRAWARYGFEPARAVITVHLVRAPCVPAGAG